MMDQNNMNNSNSVSGMNFVTEGTPETVNTQPTTLQQATMVQPAAPEPASPQPLTGNIVVQTETPMSGVVNPQPVVAPVQQPLSAVGNDTTAINNVASVQPQLNQIVMESQPVQSTNGLNSISPVQPVDNPQNTEVNVPAGLEESEQKKKRNPIVVILILVLLTVIGVGLGIFLFNKFGNKENNQSQEQAVEDGNNASTSLNNNVINNTNVDSDKLQEVLSIVGISATSDVANNDVLNYYISDNNYVENADKIILYYSVDANGNTKSTIDYPEEYDKMSDVGACSNSVGCALITKLDAENVLKKFNFGTDLTKYFYKSSEIDDVYGIHYGETLVMGMFNHSDAGITHNLNAEMSDTDINIVDTQTINYVNDEGNIQTNNKTVTYVFKLSTDESYNLSSVSVGE